MRSRAAVLLTTAAVLAACGAPGDTSTPERTLAALATAVDADDSAAVDRLLCPAGRHVGHSMQQVRDGLVELDPAFGNAHWHAEPGPVTSRTDTQAAATLTITTVGWPATIPPLVEDFLDAGEVPRPLNGLGEGGEITLVLQDGHWLACGPTAVR